MRIDQPSESRPIALLPDMPVVNQRELPIGDAPNRVGHAIEAEIDAVGQDRREQGRLVVRRPAVALMREAVSKSGPAVDVEQDIRDLAGRQQRVGGLLNLLSLGWRARLHRRDVRSISLPWMTRDRQTRRMKRIGALAGRDRCPVR